MALSIGVVFSQQAYSQVKKLGVGPSVGLLLNYGPGFYTGAQGVYQVGHIQDVADIKVGGEVDYLISSALSGYVDLSMYFIQPKVEFHFTKAPGLYAGAGLLFTLFTYPVATFSLTSGSITSTTESKTSTAAALALSGGYDFWIMPHISVGPSLQIALGGLTSAFTLVGNLRFWM